MGDHHALDGLDQSQVELLAGRGRHQVGHAQDGDVVDGLQALHPRPLAHLPPKVLGGGRGQLPRLDAQRLLLRAGPQLGQGGPGLWNQQFDPLGRLVVHVGHAHCLGSVVQFRLRQRDVPHHFLHLPGAGHSLALDGDGKGRVGALGRGWFVLALLGFPFGGLCGRCRELGHVHLHPQP